MRFVLWKMMTEMSRGLLVDKNKTTWKLVKINNAPFDFPVDKNGIVKVNDWLTNWDIILNVIIDVYEN